MRLVSDQITVSSGPDGTRATVVFALPGTGPPFAEARPGGSAPCPDSDYAGAVGTLKTSVAAGDSGPVVVLSGESDIASAGQLSDLLTAQLSGGAQRMLVDVSELRFADSASVRALVLAGKTLRDRGGTLVLARPQRAVARLLALMGVDELLVVQGGAASEAKIKDCGTRESDEERRPPGGPY
ncbi:MAG: STAS domain-containing protein [Actinomycetota bacterium]|nr:STAS domain-containing protein [Actinomycetota bacterium]